MIKIFFLEDGLGDFIVLGFFWKVIVEDMKEYF